MNKRWRVLLLIISFCAVVLAATLSYTFNNKTVDKEQLKEQAADLDSYTHEAQFLLEQYNKNKTTFSYTKIQLQYINKKTLFIPQEATTSTIPANLQHDVQNLSQLSMELSNLLTLATNANGHKKILQTQKKEFFTVQKEIETFQKEYE